MIKTGEAAKNLGSSPAQLCKWALTGELLPARKTKGNILWVSDFFLAEAVIKKMKD